jgi:hypothetical protein
VESKKHNETRNLAGFFVSRRLIWCTGNLAKFGQRCRVRRHEPVGGG